MDWWNKIKDLFQESKKSSLAQPALHRVLERTARYRSAYETWLSGINKRRFCDWLLNQYVHYQMEPTRLDKALDFLDTPSSKGFVVHLYKTPYEKEEAQFILDYFRERVLDFAYVVQLSDWRTYNRPKWVETVERYYLKPRQRMVKDKEINQQFGNIRIELVFRDERIYHLKFSATGYQDRLYKEADEFKKLVQHLCG